MDALFWTCKCKSVVIYNHLGYKDKQHKTKVSLFKFE